MHQDSEAAPGQSETANSVIQLHHNQRRLVRSGEHFHEVFDKALGEGTALMLRMYCTADSMAERDGHEVITLLVAL